ncbi:MAG TPA: AraC family transcriptional regulator [Nitrospirales bacterium]|nr:hypothetical protein [Nitrospiraceae bacterium]HNP29067.1 AraC family transcriptional regulator [Nitrospirales bacterium]
MTVLPFAHRACELVNVGSSLVEQGVRPGHLLKQVGLPAHALLDVDAWVPRPLFLKLINSLVRMTGEPYIVLHIAERDPIEKLGLYGQAILNAHTLRQALSIAGKRISLVQTGVRLGFHEQEMVARLSYEFIGRTGENPETYIEGVLAFLLKILRLTRQDFPVQVSFTRSKPRDTGEFERVFGSDLCFNAEYNGFTFDRSSLDLPLQLKISEDLFTQEGRLTPYPEEHLVRSVQSTIAYLMPRQSPTLEMVAREHGLHKRTLQRRLNRWGISFEDLLDQLRRECALKFVRQGSQTITDVALLLGYSDSSHFNRAFRRWTGMAPRDFVSAEVNANAPIFSSATIQKPSQSESCSLY